MLQSGLKLNSYGLYHVLLISSQSMEEENKFYFLPPWYRQTGSYNSSWNLSKSVCVKLLKGSCSMVDLRRSVYYRVHSKKLPLRESGITPKIIDLFLKFKNERKASSLGLLMRGHLSTCVSSLLKKWLDYVKRGQIESCTLAHSLYLYKAMSVQFRFFPTKLFTRRLKRLQFSLFVSFYFGKVEILTSIRR